MIHLFDVLSYQGTFCAEYLLQEHLLTFYLQCPMPYLITDLYSYTKNVYMYNIYMCVCVNLMSMLSKFFLYSLNVLFRNDDNWI